MADLVSAKAAALRALTGISIIGHFRSATGLGAASRGTVAAVRESGLPFTLTDLPQDELFPSPLPEASQGTCLPNIASSPFSVVLLHTNPDAALEALNTPGSGLDVDGLRARFSIGYWAWEASAGIPLFWRALTPLVREIWVPSSFTAAAVAADVPLPVVPMPHAVQPPDPVFSRDDLGIPGNVFCFLFMLDATSNVTRKNPFAVIRAYRAAFPDGCARTRLIIKAKKLSNAQVRELVLAAGGRADIQIINESYPAEKAASLMHACDVYVSLHRAEGFGLTLAEAMACGKPVIATAYSGNMDFMTPDTGYLVPYSLRPLEADDGYYRRGILWADADVEQAALCMRHAADNPEAAKALGMRAASRIAEILSPAAVGKRMRSRLEVLAAAGRLPFASSMDHAAAMS